MKNLILTINSFDDAVFVLPFYEDHPGKFLAANDVAYARLGYSRLELLQLSASEVGVMPRSQAITALAQSGHSVFETELISKSGEKHSAELSCRLLAKDGNTYAICVARDISERKRSELALRRLNRELRAISSCNQALLRANDEICLLNEICRIICDDAGYRMAWVGYAHDDDEAKTIRPAAWAGYEDGYLAAAKVAWAASTDRGRGAAGTCVRTGEASCFQDFDQDPSAIPWRDDALQRGYRSVIALPLKDRSDKAFGTLCIYSGEPNAFSTSEIRLLGQLAADLAFGIVVLRLRTEKRRTEEAREKLQAQLLQAQKMESVGRLAAGIAHDFNNMLSVIVGRTELALFGLGQTNPFYETFQDIKTAGETSVILTRQLLAFARKQAVTPKVLNLNDAVQGSLSILRRLIGEDITLIWSPGDQLWPIMMDPGQVDQVLANLCVNARDAIVGVGTVIIETSNLVIDKAYSENHPGVIPGDYVQISICDNGSGMDKATQLLIFEPFFTTKPAGVGTGLGLATVYGIVDQNNGFIDVDSEPGHGTTFTIQLRRHQTITEPQLPRASTLPPAAGTETVLLVEDDSQSLKSTKLVLEYLGYSVLTASTPLEALQLAQEYAQPIQMLFTDVIMPEMDGWDLAKELALICPSIRCLFTSGYPTNVIAHHGTSSKDVPFIQKPFAIRALASKIREVLGKQGNEMG